jgi:hypothetical protein
MPAPDLSEVQDGFRGLGDRYQALKRDCEARVVSWRWASDHVYEPCPLYFMTRGFKPGRLLKQTPKRIDNKYEYGYDEGGTVQVERQYIDFSSDAERRWFYETFYVRRGPAIEGMGFDYHPDKKARFFHRGDYDERGRLMFWRSWASGGASRDAYTWEGERVVRIDSEYARADNSGAIGPLLPYINYGVEYAADGDLQKIVAHWQRRPDHPRESSNVVYQRLPATQTLDGLLATLLPALKEAIVQRIRAARVSGPVYSLALPWDPGQYDSLPPSIGLGLDGERQSWLEKEGKHARRMIWNPAEYENFLEIPTATFEETLRAVNQELRLKEAWQRAERMLNDLARELGRMDWSGVMQTTDDFVAYAVDLGLTRIRRNLKYSAPPHVFEAFAAKRWL